MVRVRDAPLLAVALPRVIEFAPTRESGPLTFVGIPDLAAALAKAPEFRLLSCAELDGPVDIVKWPRITGSLARWAKP